MRLPTAALLEVMMTKNYWRGAPSSEFGQTIIIFERSTESRIKRLSVNGGQIDYGVKRSCLSSPGAVISETVRSAVYPFH